MSAFGSAFGSQAKSLLLVDKVTAFKNKLEQLSSSSDNTYFKDHCQAFISVIDNVKPELTGIDTTLLNSTFDVFNASIDGYPSVLSSYLERQRPFILSWTSPTDGAVSFSWLKLPKDWDPDKEYPLYIELHGLWGVADNPIEYLTYPFRSAAANNFAFEDGYLLSPWGRGNLWYKGISEIDIWDCIAALEEKVKIDQSRKYLCGHSMGGFGAWYIGYRSVSTWAALGIHAGALWYDSNVLLGNVFVTLKDMPTYFVVGNVDGLYDINYSAYLNLEEAGNPNVEFVTFNGGHEYLDENVQNMYLWLRNFTNSNMLSSNRSTLEKSSSETLECYPNPVKGNVLVNYHITVANDITISLYNVFGQLVKRLDKGYKLPGDYNIPFDASELPSGIYTCSLQLSTKAYSIKIAVIR